MTKLLIAVTADSSVRLLDGQLEYMSNHGFDVHLVVSKGVWSNRLAQKGQITVHQIPMERDIAILKDIKALILMIHIFRKVKPDISNVGTPKAALLGSIAAFLTRTKKRIYTLRGLRMETETGAKQRLLRFIEELIMFLSTKVIAVSPSLITKARELGLKGTDKMLVLGKGSSNGLRLENFMKKSQEKIENPFQKEKFVIGFSGRITKDKGIEELIDAFCQIEDANLLLVGGIDANHCLKEKTLEIIKSHPCIYITGWLDNPAPFYKYMDIFVIPSYREGFANVCLEAAASELAVIGTNVTGIKDSVINGETGLLIPVKSKDAIQIAVKKLRHNKEIRQKLGAQGKQRVINDFQSGRIWTYMVAEYARED
ncbi:glycosyltransferase family 4 protein [Listeria booriae]|uniref:Glycosyltransferase family 4 protein n=1 Tax=Listeria booriae TaxID=1552123 RepID=A0A841ZZN3_9LIST|nr:glycosyltransferase family 4 protein [Listeria booriae]MBC1565093.1 glycosyltransferase family 4 protein [Listeria booriae]